jgi:ATP-dependent DNA ligase
VSPHFGDALISAATFFRSSPNDRKQSALTLLLQFAGREPITHWRPAPWLLRGRWPPARRAGTGITDKELKRLAGVLAPLQVKRMPLAEPPPRDSRFGSPLQLSKVHWVRPEIVVEVTFLTWTEDNLLRQVSYQGQREDKPARQVVRPIPHLPG